MTWALGDKPLRSVLVTRLRYLGDVVMSTVVPQVLKMGDPDLRVGFLCESPFAQILQGHPYVDQLFCLGAPPVESSVGTRQVHPQDSALGGSFRQIACGLRAAKFDLAIDLFFNPRSALILKSAGIPERIGGTSSLRRYLYSRCVTRQASQVYAEVLATLAPGGMGDHLCRLTPLRHVESGKTFGDWLGELGSHPPFLPTLPTPTAQPQLDQYLAQLGIDGGQPFLVCGPGATWRAKEWPHARWREFLESLLHERKENILILVPPGGPSRWSSLGDVVPPGRGGVLPPLALGDVMGVLSRARAVVSVDGGIMHCAVGVGVPTLALFGPTEAEIWFPYDHDPRFRVLGRHPPCHPCHLRECEAFSCLPDIRADEVLSGLAGILGGV